MRPRIVKTGLIVTSLVFSLGAHAAGMGAAPAASAPRMEGATASRAGAKARVPTSTGQTAPMGTTAPPTINDYATTPSPSVGAGQTTDLNTGASSGSINGTGINGGASAGVQTNCSAPYAPAGCSSTQ